ncbi:hypothetical protein LOD99_12138 [Oopsacas minuta]|uniref:Uncharacterized protein n=1 Tax=Oopsacas minuta TaxID=111878 RepID=A0AAV7JHN5_9METZ|nr:hypothetical protein LOD99_12138 [Oopsacas minuta]
MINDPEEIRAIIEFHECGQILRTLSAKGLWNFKRKTNNYTLFEEKPNRLFKNVSKSGLQLDHEVPSCDKLGPILVQYHDQLGNSGVQFYNTSNLVKTLLSSNVSRSSKLCKNMCYMSKDSRFIPTTSKELQPIPPPETS